MALKILLINSNAFNEPYPVYPLGISYLASHLKASGYEAKLFDFAITPNDLESNILNFKPDYIGISIQTMLMIILFFLIN